MNAQKDIFTAFREGSEQLTVQPSTRSWQKLEHRLDEGKKRHGRVVAMRWLTAIAATLVLFVGVYFVNNLSKGPGIALDTEPSPSFLEDLVNTGGCTPYCILLNARKELPDYYANPVRKY
ncbi:MAG: hypothetical protein K9J37_18585 [Saprospiraceae bacterium]|nr:hypothetical protein [Saprospiraceae bacterium]MCF8251929.1 hypothetical protein [Saprospiraceae bacterium]MCF8281629.1 hypothetical protein [Bacteroidales bacterium]MCF8313615.1 hypothetical protein [Saprospiraceae bacterium]MCF8442313.1 hypothetical protein [Saprospiraceae bacterium]